MTDFDLNKLDADLFCKVIAHGLLDADIERLHSALNRRQGLMASQKLSSLEIGQEITISNSVRPKLLAGALCTVTGFQGGEKVEVKLQSWCSEKWYRGKTVILPKSLIG